jgi:hypothetical protein
MVEPMLALQLQTKKFNNLHQQGQLHLMYQLEQLLFMCWLLEGEAAVVEQAVVEQAE